MFKVGDRVVYNMPEEQRNRLYIKTGGPGIVVHVRKIDDIGSGGIDVKWPGIERIFYNYHEDNLLLVPEANDILKGMLR